MGKRKALRLALQLLVIALVALALSTYWDYRQDLRAARKRVQTGAQVAETPAGPIEYATGGDGAPVLVVHGAGGGFDQGAALARWLLGDEYRWVAPSRFGYLGTPLPDDASAEAQANAHAALLDELGIQQAAVIAMSAGGPSSLHFAVAHPERCSALVLLSAFSRPDPSRAEDPDRTVELMFRWDLLGWLIMKGARTQVMEMAGVTPEVAARLTPEEQDRMTEMLDLMLPVSPRREGVINDNRAPISEAAIFLGEITTPTLIVHADNDVLVPLQ